MLRVHTHNHSNIFLHFQTHVRMIAQGTWYYFKKNGTITQNTLEGPNSNNFHDFRLIRYQNTFKAILRKKKVLSVELRSRDILQCLRRMKYKSDERWRVITSWVMVPVMGVRVSSFFYSSRRRRLFGCSAFHEYSMQYFFNMKGTAVSGYR